MLLHSVSMEHFMAVSGRLEAGPFEPGINLVLGPNGAGKSTISLAVALALGADVQHLHRVQHVGELIARKGNYKKAYIRLELRRQDDQLEEDAFLKVECTLRKNKETEYLFNGKVVDSAQEQRRLCAESGLPSPANPCSFIQQDGMADLVRLTPVQTLELVVKSIDGEASSTLVALRHLKENSDRQRSLLPELESARAGFARMLAKWETMKNIEDDLKQKNQVEADLDNVVHLLKYSKILAGRKQIVALRNKAEAGERDLEAAKRALADLEEELKDFDESLKALEEDKVKAMDKRNAEMRKCEEEYPPEKQHAMAAAEAKVEALEANEELEKIEATAIKEKMALTQAKLRTVAEKKVRFTLKKHASNSFVAFQVACPAGC